MRRQVSKSRSHGVSRWQGWDLSWGLSCFCIWCPCYSIVRSLLLIQLDLWICAPACKTRLEFISGERKQLPRISTPGGYKAVMVGDELGQKVTQNSLKPENFLQGQLGNGWVLEESDSGNVNRYRLGLTSDFWHRRDLLENCQIFSKAIFTTRMGISRSIIRLNLL